MEAELGKIKQDKLGLSWANLRFSYVEVKIEVVVKVEVEDVF